MNKPVPPVANAGEPMNKPAPPIVKLKVFIDEHDRLIALTAVGLEPIRADRGLEDLVAGLRDAKAVTVEVCDFLQRNTIYRVYGATLDDDRHQVLAHWESTGHGVRQTFELPTPSAAGKIKLVIGALPGSPVAPTPQPFASRDKDGGGGSLPIGDPDDPKGPAK
jgi:hypothetical protein